jgi:hypothetical protein
MSVRVASGLFRLWVVFSVLWLAAAGAFIVVSYQNAPQHNLIHGQMAFDDLIPAYEHCWRSGDGKTLGPGEFISDKDFAQIAECERGVDRWQIVRNDILIALCIPIIALVLGWAFVSAFRGFLPAQKM